MDIPTLNKAADNIRVLSVAMVEQAKSGHPGGSMGGADFMNVLFSEFMVFDPDNPSWPHRDRFFLDPGHLSPMLYSTLSLIGNYSMDELKQFRQWESPTPGHPEKDFTRGVENTSGPLGQGHAFAVGAAITERFLVQRFGEWMAHKTYAYISDGGIQEGISQEAGRIAGFLGLGNLIMFFDANEVQLSSTTHEVTTEDTGKKYESWGWHVVTVEGSNAQQLHDAIKAAHEETDRPTLIIGKTIMGKGVLTEGGESLEGGVDLHGKPISKAGASVAKTITTLGGDPDKPFQLFPDVTRHYAQVLEKKREIVAQRKADQAIWETANPELTSKLEEFLSGKIPEVDYSAITQKNNVATRNASSTVLQHYADSIENMIVASADLSNSDKTDGFLKKTKAFERGDFSGRFLQMGVSEFAMAAICNGMALHGGVIPVCATFFVFSDYMKPALRLAALMELPVKFIWTHDAFRVGEDGPTHQPIEQEAQIRLLEQVKNHSGKRSFLVLRPADAHETTLCWKLALEKTDGPSGLILSRQNIPDVPASNGSSRFEAAHEASKGAYIVQDTEGDPDIILVGNGSEVSTLIEGAKRLAEEKHMKVRVVSAPSEGLFRDQEKEYQQSILPAHVPTLGLTAGLPLNLQGLVGPSGKAIGLDHFGYSAPYTVLDQKFGYTADNVFEQVRIYLEEFEG
ncbi:MAG: transketolase [Bacteroidota bacterium]